MKKSTKKKGDNMKKIMMVAVIAMAAFMVMPSVSALGALNKVNDITQTEKANEGTYNEPTQGVSKDGHKTTTFDIENTSLIVLKKVGEMTEDNAAWFGIGVEAPAEGANDICWKRAYDNVKGAECTKVESPDGQSNDYTLWIHFTAAEMKAAIEKDGENAIITKEATIYWNGEGNDAESQKIIVNLHAGSVQLIVDPVKSSGVAETAAFTEEDKEEALEVYNENHKPEVVEPQTTEEKKDEANPDTADINLYLLLSLIITSGCGIAYSVRKRFN